MNHYYAAVQGISTNGTIEIGNVDFHSESLTVDVLKEMMVAHCAKLLEQGRIVSPKQMMVLSVIRLDK